MTTTPKVLLCMFLAGCPCLLASRLDSQEPIPEANPGVSQLAAKIGDLLQKAHVTKVVFADLKGPSGETHPVGGWLAEQLTAACSKDFPSLAVISQPANEAAGTSPDDQKDPAKSVEDLGDRTGANVVVTGTFAELPNGINGIGVSLRALGVSGPHSVVAQADGLILITATVAALSPDPLPKMPAGVPRAGVAGVGVPTCDYCPPPTYTSKARHAGLQGTVALQVTITPDGRATNISVTKSLSPDMDAQAIKAVSKWRFKPAPGLSGNPVPVIAPIEVTFQLFNSGS